MDERYTLSAHVDLLMLDEERTIVSHGPLLRRAVFRRPLLAQLERFRGAALSEDELARAGDSSPSARERLRRAFLLFREHGFIVPTSKKENQALRVELSTFGLLPALPTRAPFEVSRERDLDGLDAAPGFQGETREATFLILGGCLSQLAADSIRARAPRSSLVARVVTGWPQDVHLVDEVRPDVVLFQPGTGPILAPLWDDLPFLTDVERRERLDLLSQRLRASIQLLLDLCRGRLLIVQGISTPSLSPDGRTSFRSRVSLTRIASELNLLLEELLRDTPGAFFLDEEQLFSRSGKARLLDDVLPLAASRLLADEVLACYDLARGAGRIRCVVTGLDGTLWPGSVGPTVTAGGLHAGIHQALRILRSRGVLLATASRHDEVQVRARWKEIVAPIAESRWALTPDDFVLHSVSRERTSASVASIAETLGLPLDSILFLDDSPVEREDVRAALPAVRVLGEEMHRVRERLLTDPCLETRSEVVSAPLVAHAPS